MRNVIIIFLGLSFFTPLSVLGQNLDSVSVTRDTASNKNPLKQTPEDTVELLSSKPDYPTGKKAGLFSALVPGLGQAINHQYWKIPVIYGVGAVAGYFIYTNLQQYNDFREVYIGRLNNDPAAFQKHPELTNLDQIHDAMNYYQRYLNLTVALTIVAYALQVIDAVVYANLRGFDISPDISLKMQPVIYNKGSVGFGLVMSF